MTNQSKVQRFIGFESSAARAAADELRSHYFWFELSYYCLRERLKYTADRDGRPVASDPNRRVVALRPPEGVNAKVIWVSYEISAKTFVIRGLKIVFGGEAPLTS
jgi:hypothetical protein